MRATKRDAPAFAMDGPDQSGMAVATTALIGFAALAWFALRPLPAPPPAPEYAPAPLFATAARPIPEQALLAQAAAPAASAADVDALPVH